MITRDQAWVLLTTKLQNQNLRRHCQSVEAVMRALARHFSEDETKWGIIGLLHDGDYEQSKDTPHKHTLLMVEWLKTMGETDPELVSAILSHNYSHTGQHPPINKLEWSLNCCDELTGLIVAVALVMPEKKLAAVTADAVLKKFPQRAFVHREQVAQCEEQLDIPLPQFVGITLTAMQSIAGDLGL